MTKSITRDSIYRHRRFTPETIELCVRWYITYRLSYRDLATMMVERGIAVSHTTIMRWVLRYVLEFERRWSRFARPPGSSWRMDETAVAVRGGRHYLYRAVDRRGKSVASLLCTDREMGSAQTFFRSAVIQEGVPWPDKINLDGNKATLKGLRLLRQEDSCWRTVEVRTRRYLNNVVEQDHRAIKRRVAAMLGLKSFASAAITLAGIELAHRIRKGQYLLPLKHHGRPSSLKESWDAALSGASTSASPEIGRVPPTHQNSRAHRHRAVSKRLLGQVRYQRKISFGEICVCYFGRKADGTGTTITGTAESARPFRLERSRMFQLLAHSLGILPRGSYWQPAWIHRSEKESYGVTVDRSARGLAAITLRLDRIL